MPKDEQEIDEIVQHTRLLGTLLVGLQEYIIPSESTRLMYVLKGGIGRRSWNRI